jgi:DNA-binding NtrC family response regulator
MIGRSAVMQVLFRRIERVAPIDVPVLIVGESGTGKELVARAIYQLSRRRERRIEVVNCGALTRELLLSELFGHERGAFTGAVVRKAGLLTIADGGTVFLDEVGDLPLDAQVMLLRFFQHGEFRPIGSTETRRVDVRLVAATHRDLEEAVERRTFREDLYYRLRRVVLEVPPLRARREDIALLVEHVRVQANERYGLAVGGMTRQALAMIEHAPWPGNVRELEAVLEEAMIFRGQGVLGPEDLNLPRVRPGRPQPAAMPANDLVSETLPWPQAEALRIVAERREVRRGDIMARCGISREVARRELAGLVRAGLLRRAGGGRGTRYTLAAKADRPGMETPPLADEDRHEAGGP